MLEGGEWAQHSHTVLCHVCVCVYVWQVVTGQKKKIKQPPTPPPPPPFHFFLRPRKQRKLQA